MRERAAMGRECGRTSVMSAAAPSMAHGPLRVEERWLSRRARVEGEEAGEEVGGEKIRRFFQNTFIFA